MRRRNGAIRACLWGEVVLEHRREERRDVEMGLGNWLLVEVGGGGEEMYKQQSKIG